MRILVTGGAGQVGTDLLKRLHADGHAVRCFDLVRRTPGVPDDVEWIRGDVVNPAEVFDCVFEFAPEVIYHFAALLSATGEKRPHGCYTVNMHGTRNVLEAARLAKTTPQVVFASTIAVFGNNLPTPEPEHGVGDDVPLQPTTMYGVTKVAGELLGAYYQKKWGLDFRGVRFPGLINAGIPGGGTSDYALLMYIDGIRYGRYECFVGENSAIPMMYMPDALRALTELSAAPRKNLRRSIYNIGAFSPTAEDFAHAVRARVPGVEITFKADPVRQAILDSWPRAVNDQNANDDWGWKAEYTLDKMSDELVRDLQEMLKHQ